MILIRKLIASVVFPIVALPILFLVLAPFFAIASFFDDAPFLEAMIYRYKRALYYWFWIAPVIGFTLG
jgi:hypothetical protein